MVKKLPRSGMKVAQSYTVFDCVVLCSCSYVGLTGGVGISMDSICVDTLDQSTGGSVALASLGLGFWCRVGNDIVLDRVLAQGQGANRFVGVAHLLSQSLA